MFPENIKSGHIPSIEAGKTPAGSREATKSLGIINTIKGISRATREGLSRLPAIAFVLICTSVALASCDRRDPYDLPYVNGTGLVLKDPALDHILKCQRTTAFDLLKGLSRDPKLKKACDDVPTGKIPEDIAAQRAEFFEGLGIPGDTEKWRRRAEGQGYTFDIIVDPAKIDGLSMEAKDAVKNADDLNSEATAKQAAFDAYRRQHLAEGDAGNPEIQGMREFMDKEDLGKSMASITGQGN